MKGPKIHTAHFLTSPFDLHNHINIELTTVRARAAADVVKQTKPKKPHITTLFWASFFKNEIIFFECNEPNHILRICEPYEKAFVRWDSGHYNRILHFNKERLLYLSTTPLTVTPSVLCFLILLETQYCAWWICNRTAYWRVCNFGAPQDHYQIRSRASAITIN